MGYDGVHAFGQGAQVLAGTGEQIRESLLQVPWRWLLFVGCYCVAGLNMQMVETGKGDIKLISHCPKHCKPKPQHSGEALALTPLVSTGETLKKRTMQCF